MTSHRTTVPRTTGLSNALLRQYGGIPIAIVMEVKQLECNFCPLAYNGEVKKMTCHKLSPISKIRNINFVGIDDLIIFRKFHIIPINTVAGARLSLPGRVASYRCRPGRSRNGINIVATISAQPARPCGTQMGPMWAAHVGPTWVLSRGPIWDPDVGQPRWDQDGSHVGPTWDQCGVCVGFCVGSVWDPSGPAQMTTMWATYT